MRDQDDTPMRERWTGEYDGLEGNGSDEIRESGKHQSKDNSKNNGRREEKDHRSKDQERSKTIDGSKEREKENKDSASSKNRRKEDRDGREKDEVRDKFKEKDVDREKHREKERDKERRDRGKEKEREREREKELEKDGERGRDKERGNEKSREKAKDREKERDRAKDKEQEKHKDRERERENGRERSKDAVERDKVKERNRGKEKQIDQEKDRTRDRDRNSRKHKDESHDRNRDVEEDGYSRLVSDYARDNQSTKEGVDNSDDENDSKILKHQQNADSELVVAGSRQSSNLEERISKMREERLKKSSEGASEVVLSWVNRSRKLEEKRNAEKEKALQLSKIFEEQDKMNDEESDDEIAVHHKTQYLGGVKILHGLNKVLEGGAVVLTLKDQSILADGDINQEVDMLENVEIGEQKRRDEAYMAAKKKPGVYDDKFNDEPGAEKKILPKYDDPVADEGVTLDSSGRFTGEAERKLEELRKRIQGVSSSSHGEDLNSTGKISTDYYTQEEMMKFKKPKKKKSLRKKEKLDIDALEAESISAGLGAGDLGSRSDGRRQNLREERERAEAEMRSNAYQSAYAKADEASKALRQEQVHTIQTQEDDTPVFGDDDDELRKSLERARKIALKIQVEEEKTGPRVITILATSTANDSTADNPNSGSGEQQENKVVFTEMEEFVWGLQLDEEAQKPDSEDVFMEEDVVPSTFDQEMKGEDGGWAEVKETLKDETPAKEEEEVVPDVIIHESAVGKGLAGALKLLKDRGTLKETIEWGGRNMDKKKSKLVGIYDNGGAKEILIERTDEYGRILTPKESFRLLSHKFHGKGPGKMKQEKRMRQYQEELKIKQMKNADTPSLSVERMREAQAKLQTPYLVLSGHVKPGQSSDPRSGFATVEKDLAGGLTPMLGNKKVEHFLNIKHKFEPGDTAAQKKPKT